MTCLLSLIVSGKIQKDKESTLAWEDTPPLTSRESVLLMLLVSSSVWIAQQAVKKQKPRSLLHYCFDLFPIFLSTHDSWYQTHSKPICQNTLPICKSVCSNKPATLKFRATPSGPPYYCSSSYYYYYYYCCCCILESSIYVWTCSIIHKNKTIEWNTEFW